MTFEIDVASLLSGHSLDSINDILAGSHAEVSYLGSRSVVMHRNIAFTPIDQLTREILGAAQQRYDADDLTLQERVLGLEIADKLVKFYKDTDHILTQSNCFTKLIARIRQIPLSAEDKWNAPCTRITYSVSEHYQGSLTKYSPSLKEFFQGFSEVKFNQVFGNRTEENVDRITGYPNGSIRIIATEEAIREKWASKNTVRRYGQSS